MKFNPNQAFNDLPPLPPKSFKEDDEIFRKLISAHKALAELKGYSELLPNKSIILSAITIQEAKDSSEIENIVTTHDEIFKSLATNKSISPQAKEVINYKKALFRGLELLRKKQIITLNLILEIQQIIERNNAGIRKLPGTKLVNPKNNEVYYTPPDNPEVINKLLDNLIQFINTDDDGLDPLTKLAIIHYQFEAIHPFYDANGRTGRILNVLYLVYKQLISEPYIYLSGYLIKHKPEYYKLLRAVTFENAWKDWIMFFIEAVEKTAWHTLTMSKQIIATLEQIRKTVRSVFPKIYTKELIDVLFTNVYVKISTIEKQGIASRNTASLYLNKLTDIGILTVEKVGREKIFINKPLFDLLKQAEYD